MKQEEIESWYDAEKEKLFTVFHAAVSSGKDKKISEARYTAEFQKLNKAYAHKIDHALAEDAQARKRKGTEVKKG